MALAVQPPDEAPQPLAQFDVDARGRLVEDDHRRLVHQRLGDQHAALHAAREAAHVDVGLGGQVEVGENLVDPVIVLADAEVAGLDAQRLAHLEEGVENQFLRHDAEQAARRAVITDDIVAEHLEGARIGAHQPRQRRDQCRLAGAVGAEQTEEFALGDVERHPGQRLEDAEMLDDVDDRDGRNHAQTPQARGSSSLTP